VLELGVRDARFEGSWIPHRSGTYTWRFSDAEGGEAAVSPGPLSLAIVPDLPPRSRSSIPAWTRSCRSTCASRW